MDKAAEKSDSQSNDDRIRLLERRLARSETARVEAENLLETKSRSLAAAEEILQQKEEQLIERVNRQTLSLISAQNLASVATFHGDEDKRFIGSKNFAEVIGSKSPVTSFDQFAKMVHPQDREAAMEILLAADRGELIGRNVKGDFRFCDDYGNTRWLRWAVTQSQSADGKRFFGYGAVRDITKERHAERQERIMLKLSERRARQLQTVSEDLKHARQQEEQKSEQLAQRVSEMEIMAAALEDARAAAVAADRSKSRFLAMMSHDIRTPMNAILATLELLSISELQPDQHKKLELARYSGEQLLFLLADIIEHARTDGWKLDLKPQEMELPALLTKTAATWQPLARKKLIEISVDIPENNPQYILSDPIRIRQIIDNFVSNAIKYTSDGKIVVSTEMSEHEQQKYLKVSVSDSGKGINAEIQSRLFDDLDRGDADSSDIEGTGLGLSICKRITRAMDGEIGVTSEIDKGSIFWFRIPITISDGKQINDTKDIDPAPGKLKIDGRAPRILVAEDVEANQIVIKAMLETMGCETKVVDDGSQVLDALDQGSFDGILMDVWMPMNGMEATSQVRASRDHANTPIYGVTAFAGNEERSAILASGMDGVISKPINLAGLHYAIGQICSTGNQNLLPQSEDQNDPPEFTHVEYIKLEKFQEQLLAVPEKRRADLLEALCLDLTKWHEKFEQAWIEKNVQEVQAAHHALRGICNGFGAFSLLGKIDLVHQKGQIGRKEELSPVRDILDLTINAIRRSELPADRRMV